MARSTASKELNDLLVSLDVPLVAVVPLDAPRRRWSIYSGIGLVLLLAAWIVILALLIE